MTLQQAQEKLRKLGTKIPADAVVCATSDGQLFINGNVAAIKAYATKAGLQFYALTKNAEQLDLLINEENAISANT